jgi:hypothetical protein
LRGLREIGFTLILALGTAFMQTIMKDISRTDLPGKNHGLEREDALFWSDWTLAGAVALGGSVVAASIQHKVIPPGRLGLAIACIVLGCSAFPFFLRIAAYGPGARIKQWGWKGFGWVFVANAVGILILLGAVAAGVSVYDWN